MYFYFLQILEVEDTYNDEQINEPTDELTEKPVYSTLTQTQKRPPLKTNVVRTKTNKCQKVDTSLDEAVKALREVSSSHSSNSNNEFIIFGQLVGTQLSKLPLKEALVLQQEIQTKINEARIHHIHKSSKISFSAPSTSLNDTSNYSQNINQSSSLVYKETDSMNENNAEESSTLAYYFTNWDNPSKHF